MQERTLPLGVFEDHWRAETAAVFPASLGADANKLPRLLNAPSDQIFGLVVRPYLDKWVVAWMRFGGPRNNLSVRATLLSRGDLWAFLPATAGFLAEPPSLAPLFRVTNTISPDAAVIGVRCACAIVLAPAVIRPAPLQLPVSINAPNLEAICILLACALEHSAGTAPAMIVNRAPTQPEWNEMQHAGIQLCTWPQTGSAQAVIPAREIRGVDLVSISPTDAVLLHAGLFLRPRSEGRPASLDDLEIPNHLLSADQLRPSEWSDRICKLRALAARDPAQFRCALEANVNQLTPQSKRFFDRLLELADLEPSGPDRPAARRVLASLFDLLPQQIDELVRATQSH